MCFESTPQLCKGQPPGSALPCSVPQPGRRQGNLPQADALSVPCLAFKGASLCQDPMGTSGAKSLSFTTADRKSDTGAGAVSQPQSPSSPLAKAQEHFRISGFPLLPRSAHSWRVAAACVALPAVHSQPAERPWPEQPTAAATWPTQLAENTACASWAAQGRHHGRRPTRGLCERLAEVREACRQSGEKGGDQRFSPQCWPSSPSLICPSSASQQNHKLQLS